MKKIKLIVPNAITTINLICGILALVYALEGNVWEPVYFLCLSAIADLLDGLAAKLLGATSEFGKQLDSLADMVSFGVAPSVLMYKLLTDATTSNFIPYLSFSLALFSALRLARFNIQTTKKTNFTGMPVPASALVIVSIWILTNNPVAVLAPIITTVYFMIIVVAILSFLMISNLTMLSLKFEGLNFRANIWRYILLAGGLILFLILRVNSIFFIMVYYILLSLVADIAYAMKKKASVTQQ